MGPCPILIQKFNATVTHGEARKLQGDGSGVSLDIPAGSKGVYMTRVHTDHSMFRETVPDYECLVGPSVQVEHLPSTCANANLVHILKIPHCIKDRDEWDFIKVRKGDLHTATPFRELQQRQQRSHRHDYFVVDEQYITIYSRQFSLFICTSCNYKCYGTAMVFILKQLMPSDTIEDTKV